jgi:hypothetical protein
LAPRKKWTFGLMWTVMVLPPPLITAGPDASIGAATVVLFGRYSNSGICVAYMIS